MIPSPLNPSDYLKLKWALEQAKMWRGFYTGSPELTKFDKKIKEAEKVMKTIRQHTYGSKL